MEKQSQEPKIPSQVPSFYHQEIDWLYSYGLHISDEKLNTILSLPRETLIQDLELVLQDSIDRYAYFTNLAEETSWDEEQMNIVVHALFLLAELKARESLDVIFKVLSQSAEYLELYLGDFLTESIWEVMYKVAAHDLEACKQFMLKPGTYMFARGTMSTVLGQIALHEPERRGEVINWFQDAIQLLLNSNVEDDKDIYGVTASLICDAIRFEAKELLPEIEKLFERGIVDNFICGDWKSVRKTFSEPTRPFNKHEMLPIVEHYNKITSTWSFYTDDTDTDNDLQDIFDSVAAPDAKPVIAPAVKPVVSAVRTEPKVGRNEPCSCGSGKKYKKCCLNK